MVSSGFVFEVFVGNHKEFVVKSLLYRPKPIIFLDCVIKDELVNMPLLRSELRTSHLCSLALPKLLIMLKFSGCNDLFFLVVEFIADSVVLVFFKESTLLT